MAQSTVNAAATATLHKEISYLRHELKTIAEGHKAASKQIRVGDYLIERLVQLGVTVSPVPRGTSLTYVRYIKAPVRQTIFGVPGDFNLGEHYCDVLSVDTTDLSGLQVSWYVCDPILQCLVYQILRYLTRTLSKTIQRFIGPETGE